MGEHDDDLELSTPPGRPAQAEAAQIADALADGLERIATVLDRGLRDLADAMMTTSAGKGEKQREKSRQRS